MVAGLEGLADFGGDTTCYIPGIVELSKSAVTETLAAFSMSGTDGKFPRFLGAGRATNTKSNR